MVKNIKLRLILKVLLFIVILIAASIFTQQLVYNYSFSQIYQERAEQSLKDLLFSKKSSLERFIENQIGNTQTIANSKQAYDLYTEMVISIDSANMHSSNEIEQNNNFIKVYNDNVTFFSKFANTNNIDDIYIIDNSYGHVMFTIKGKKSDWRTSLNTGKYKDSPLAKIWEDTRKKKDLHISDFKLYEPAGSRKVMFIAMPLLVQHASSATVVLRISEKNIYDIIDSQSSQSVFNEICLIRNSSQKELDIITGINTQNTIKEDFTEGAFIDLAIHKKETGVVEKVFSSGQSKLVAYTPINAKKLNWAMFLTLNKVEVEKPVAQIRNKGIVLACLIFVVLCFIAFTIANRFVNPIFFIQDNLDKLSKGILPNASSKISRQAELRGIINAFFNVVKGMRSYVEFADKIGNKQLDAVYTPLSDKDVLGKSLQTMQRNLIEAERSAQQRRAEEEKQNWMTQGVARFSDILRSNHDSIYKHSENIIVNLTSIVNADQGGLFIHNEEDPNNPYLEMTASIAYGRVKYAKKRLEIQEGLIGACFLEKETIHLKNIPDNYPEITSGLGGSAPKEVLIVPLKIDTKILGVLELVSFNKFEQHIITFVERIAENIASSISSQKINERTSKLLEEARMQSEMLATQEEEMRQNMEELQATQEESQRHETEMRNIIDAVELSVYIAYLSVDGYISHLNDKYINDFAIDAEEYVSSDFNSISAELTEEQIQKIKDGEILQRESIIHTPKKQVKVKEHFKLLYNTYDSRAKIICISYPI